MKEIVFYGRGGHGAVMASELTAIAAYKAGMQSQAFPFFGGERRGAPVKAFARIDTQPIRVHSQIYEPDIIVILDAELLKVARESVSSIALKAGGSIVINLPGRDAAEKYAAGLNANIGGLAFVDATSIARELGLVVAGWPVINTAMLGAMAKATGVIGLENMANAIEEYWPKPLADKNIEAARKGYEMCTALQRSGAEGGF
ncbi:MAG: 2-oxoacid:acceptor oxidoreductase family protein [Candidatus Marsarchaeota archaeon]|jgi:2-oxoacid:acceptor oxidoreductase gamma subunit (pyruvate/2-ketoisovalerate family)|nr:2-oxoacid:acceptor oxidoreductase family protein [Candidatus Marsarchaeota archaeon]